MKKEDINQIILVGGSTRIPRVREIVKEFFPNCKINKDINPDEAVAYGATIDAEKILHNRNNNISNVHFLDITPLSLGTNILNNSIDPEIRKEGNIMSVIIKRGTPVPTIGKETYYNVKDDQTTMSIDIYEGEKKYVKYNHLLKRSEIKGLTKRPKGKTKVNVKFEIDINGILNIKAQEESDNNDGKTLELTIKNDEISLSPKEIENLQIKNEELINKISKKIDFSNLKDTLKKYKEEYETTEDEEDKIIIITNYNNILEEFIDKFDRQYDNETVLEKQYLYVKELFSSYMETLQLQLGRGDEKNIFDNIKKYIEIFIDKTSGYLNNLLNILEKLKVDRKYKVEFYNLIITIMEKLNEHGKACIYSNAKFCKYHSLIYFEQSEAYYQKYISDIKTSILKPDNLEKLNTQINMAKEYLSDIKSGAIFICEASFSGGKLYGEEMIKQINKSNQRGFTGDIIRLLFMKENFENVLANYERALTAIQAMGRMTKKEAICIANIIKLYKYLDLFRLKMNTLITLAERCDFVITNVEIDENEEWYKEFKDLKELLKQKKEIKDLEYNEKLKVIKQKHGKEFVEIENKFEQCEKKNKSIDFIKYILKNYPYKGYNKNDKYFSKYNQDLIDF